MWYVCLKIYNFLQDLKECFEFVRESKLGTWETLVLYLIQTKNRSSEVEKKICNLLFFQHHLFIMSVFTQQYYVDKTKKNRHIFHLISQPINLYIYPSYNQVILFMQKYLCKIKMLESVTKKIKLSSSANISPFIFGIYFINIFKYSAVTM